MTAEKHFNLVVLLMLFFFTVNYAGDVLFAMGLTSVKVGGNVAHDAFLAFFGVAMGIFRGLMPIDKGNEPPK